MIDFDALGDSIVDVIRRNSSFVQAIGGDAQKIKAYRVDYPLTTNRNDAIAELKGEGAILVFNGTDIIGRQSWITHRFSLYLMPIGPAGAAFKALRDGVVSGGTGIALKFYQFQPDGSPIDVLGIQLRPLEIRGGSTIEIYEVPIQVTETGVDNT